MRTRDEQLTDEQQAELRKHNQGVLDLAARLYHYRELPEYKALEKYVDEWLEDSDVGDLMYDLQVAADKHLNDLVRAHLSQRGEMVAVDESCLSKEGDFLSIKDGEYQVYHNGKRIK